MSRLVKELAAVKDSMRKYSERKALLEQSIAKSHLMSEKLQQELVDLSRRATDDACLKETEKLRARVQTLERDKAEQKKSYQVLREVLQLAQQEVRQRQSDLSGYVGSLPKPDRGFASEIEFQAVLGRYVTENTALDEEIRHLQLEVVAPLEQNKSRLEAENAQLEAEAPGSMPEDSWDRTQALLSENKRLMKTNGAMMLERRLLENLYREKVAGLRRSMDTIASLRAELPILQVTTKALVADFTESTSRHEADIERGEATNVALKDEILKLQQQLADTVL